MEGEEAGEDEQDEMDDGEDDEDEEGSGENNSVISIYFQSALIGDFTETLTIELLESILEDEFFDSLRTKDQLGYYVACSQRSTRGVPGLLFTIESSKYTPNDCEEKIMAFIENFFKTMTEESYLEFL
jgi:nardilysin